MLSLLVLDGLLALLAINRGWLLAPLCLAALPWSILPLESVLANVVLAGWWLPFSNLLICVGAFSTLSLFYTAICEPERA